VHVSFGLSEIAHQTILHHAQMVGGWVWLHCLSRREEPASDPVAEAAVEEAHVLVPKACQHPPGTCTSSAVVAHTVSVTVVWAEVCQQFSFCRSTGIDLRLELKPLDHEIH
jgi:hypothetical protein